MKIASTILASAFASILLVASARATEPGPTPDLRPGHGAEPVKKETRTGIKWKVTPANVVIFLDGKRLGEAGELKFTETKPGVHKIKLVKGGDETESEIPVKKGQAVKFVYDFSE